jgi:hypothetical protein
MPRPVHRAAIAAVERCGGEVFEAASEAAGTAGVNAVVVVVGRGEGEGALAVSTRRVGDGAGERGEISSFSDVLVFVYMKDGNSTHQTLHLVAFLSFGFDLDSIHGPDVA